LGADFLLTLDILLNNPDGIGRNIRELAGAEGNTATRLLPSIQVRVHSQVEKYV
jgi:hypothetical protein